MSGIGHEEQETSLASGTAYLDCRTEMPPECAELFQAGERDSFDLSAQWFQLLAAAATLPDSECRVYVLKMQDRIRGVLPLLLDRSPGGGQRVGGLSSYYSSLYRPLLAAPVTEVELAGCLGGIVKDSRPDVIRFAAMDPLHPTFGMLESALRRIGFRAYRFFCFGNWYLPVQGRSFEAYFGGLSSQVRNTVRRREKKFLADGRGDLHIVTGSESVESAISVWDRVYRASWKTPEPFPEFMPGLIRMCADHGWLRLGLAYYDGEPVAAQLWIVNNGRAAIYKLAYDEKYARLSAGTVLTAHMMRHALDVDRVSEVDYLTGDDAYKKDWMSHRRERWGLLAFNPRTFFGLLGLVDESARRLAKQALAWLRAMGKRSGFAIRTKTITNDAQDNK